MGVRWFELALEKSILRRSWVVQARNWIVETIEIVLGGLKIVLMEFKHKDSIERSRLRSEPNLYITFQ